MAFHLYHKKAWNALSWSGIKGEFNKLKERNQKLFHKKRKSGKIIRNNEKWGLIKD
jgi:hypothetical protein